MSWTTIFPFWESKSKEDINILFNTVHNKVKQKSLKEYDSPQK